MRPPQYFEGVLAGLKGERESFIAAAVEKGVSGRLQKMQTKMDKATKEREQAGREADRLRRVDKEYGDAMQVGGWLGWAVSGGAGGGG